MRAFRFPSIRCVCWGLILARGAAGAAAAPPADQRSASIARRATLELTFANRDLIWLGDPASPTAQVFVKPDARPTATDFYVTKRVESRESPFRHYFREARIAVENKVRQVRAFTQQREMVIGVIDERGRFSPHEFYKNNRELLPTWPVDSSQLAYDSAENALYREIDVPGPVVTEALDFLPLALAGADGNPVSGRFSINYEPIEAGDTAHRAVVSLDPRNGESPIPLAQAIVPRVFSRADVQLCSFDNQTASYLMESAYRAGAVADRHSKPSVTFRFPGEFAPSVVSEGPSLVVTGRIPSSARPEVSPPEIVVDGNFDDWRHVSGLDDARGDSVPYLEYVPDVDLLEFKVSHDDEHIYLYARVAGQVGRSHTDGGRSYFYAYMDVDRNPETGFLPTRDDECYYGVDVGDDCEVQFEFVDNMLRKTFYGFCGLGGNDNVLKQTVAIGKSQYGRYDARGAERANYKSEYTYRGGLTEITEDLKFGTSDTIQLAVSPDGGEVEIASTFTGFLKDSAGRPTVRLGQSIDVAVGMECDGKAYFGKTRWAADNTTAIRGYRLTPSDSQARVRYDKGPRRTETP